MLGSSMQMAGGDQLIAAGMTVTNDGTKTTFLGKSGDYNRIGDAGTTSQSLASEDDLLVTGKLEVDGNTFLEGLTYCLDKLNFPFDKEFEFGGSGNAWFMMESGDANAYMLHIGLANAGVLANSVPVLFLADETDLQGADVGAATIDLSGVTEPTLGLANAAFDAAVTLDAGDINGSPAGTGLYFKAAADEDVNLLKVGVTEGPTIIWDDSETAFVISHTLSASLVPYVKTSANLATTALHHIIAVDTDNAARTITLATAMVTAGRRYIIKDADGNAATNNITIATEGAETIDEAATKVINTDFGSVGVYSDGTHWYVV